MAVGRSGFTPVGTPDTRYVTNLPVSAGNRPMGKGDAVRYVAGNVTNAEAGMDPGAIFGVVLAVYTSANKPLTFNSNKIITSGNTGRADVCWDPNQIYSVKCESSVAATALPVNMMIDLSAMNTQLGISGMALTAQTSASVGNPFKVLALSPQQRVITGLDPNGDAGVEVLCVINNHLNKAGT
jgi:hypothetical protein